MDMNTKKIDIIIKVLESVEDSLSDGYRFYNDPVAENLERVAHLILSALEKE